jgi:hypothetical protein
MNGSDNLCKKFLKFPNTLQNQRKRKYPIFMALSTFSQKRFNLVKYKKKFSENKNLAFVLSRKVPLKQKKYSRSLLLTQREFCTFAVFLCIC